MIHAAEKMGYDRHGGSVETETSIDEFANSGSLTQGLRSIGDESRLATTPRPLRICRCFAVSSDL